MSRRIKEYIDIRDHATLDDLIGRLVELREVLPENAEAELRLRGDDVFGRKLSISYLREMTQEEVECEERYADVSRRAAAASSENGSEGWRDVA
jgi:hypothetical protein